MSQEKILRGIIQKSLDMTTKEIQRKSDHLTNCRKCKHLFTDHAMTEFSTWCCKIEGCKCGENKK